MRMNQLVAAAAVTLGLCSVANAAEPVAPKLSLPGENSIIQVQRDCHRDSERHYLDDYDRRLWHHHVGRHCRVVLDEDPHSGYRRYDRRPMDDNHCQTLGTPGFSFRFCP